jgi:type II restriction enzyme
MARTKNVTLSGWTADVWEVVCGLSRTFELDEVYEQGEPQLKKLHRNNKHIKAKIRQQLQKLRDLGLIKFVRPGVYRRKGE